MSGDPIDLDSVVRDARERLRRSIAKARDGYLGLPWGFVLLSAYGHAWRVVTMTESTLLTTQLGSKLTTYPLFRSAEVDSGCFLTASENRDIPGLVGKLTLMEFEGFGLRTTEWTPAIYPSCRRMVFLSSRAPQGWPR
jgi:hypothetical protein